MARRDPSLRGVWLAIITVSSVVAGAITAGVLHAASCDLAQTLSGAVAVTAGAFATGISASRFLGS